MSTGPTSLDTNSEIKDGQKAVGLFQLSLGIDTGSTGWKVSMSKK